MNPLIICELNNNNTQEAEENENPLPVENIAENDNLPLHEGPMELDTPNIAQPNDEERHVVEIQENNEVEARALLLKTD